MKDIDLEEIKEYSKRFCVVCSMFENKRDGGAVFYNHKGDCVWLSSLEYTRLHNGFGNMYWLARACSYEDAEENFIAMVMQMLDDGYCCSSHDKEDYLRKLRRQEDDI